MRSRSRSPVKRSRSRSRSPRNRNNRQRPFQGGRRVIIRNIPYDVKWQILKDMLRKEIGEVTYVEMLETPDGRSKGVAVVEFKHPKFAEKAIEDFHQKKIKDRAITVREERERDRQEFAQNKLMKERGRMGAGLDAVLGGGGLEPRLPSGINPQILHQLGIEPPITSQVFVANLDYNVTWWKLKDVFKLAGNVVRAEVKLDKEGKSKGVGIVIFEHPMEAVQAVSMFNGQALFERNMIVRIDKVAGEHDKPKLPSGLKSIGMGLGSGGLPISNISQLDLGLIGGGGLLGSGLGNTGLGLLGAGGADNFGMGRLGGGLGGLGLGSSRHGESSGGMGLSRGLSGSDIGLGGYSDSFSSNYPGLGGNNSLSGLGGLGPNLSSLSAGLGGSGDRLGLGDSMDLGRDRLGGLVDRMGGLSDRMGGGNDRMGGLGDRMGGLGDRMGGLGDRMGGLGDRMGGLGDRMGGLGDGLLGLGDRMGGLGDRMGVLDRVSDRLRESYGNSGGKDSRDDGGRRIRPDNNTVVVKNLPYSTNWQTLKEHFRDVGDVKFAEIIMEKGRSTGVGYVRFSNDSDAHRAIGMKNRSKLEGRNITVSLHRN